MLKLEGQSWSHAIQCFDGKRVKGFPFQIDEAPLSIKRPAPGIGANTATILSEIAGYSADEITALAKAGVIELGSA